MAAAALTVVTPVPLANAAVPTAASKKARHAALAAGIVLPANNAAKTAAHSLATNVAKVVDHAEKAISVLLIIAQGIRGVVRI